MTMVAWAITRHWHHAAWSRPLCRFPAALSCVARIASTPWPSFLQPTRKKCFCRSSCATWASTSRRTGSPNRIPTASASNSVGGTIPGVSPWAVRVSSTSSAVSADWPTWHTTDRFLSVFLCLDGTDVMPCHAPLCPCPPATAML